MAAASLSSPQPVEKCRSLYRWPMLMLSSLMLFFIFFAFDIPSAIKPQMNEYMGRPSNFEINFSLLYTLYAAPNVCIS
jgi:hypothetical protein